MTTNDFPRSYFLADQSSLKGQSKYKNIIAVNIVFVLMSAVLSSIDKKFSHQYEALSIITIVLLFINIALTSILLYLNFEKRWYDGRALAESIKTMAYKFMTGAAPYSVTEENVSLKFISDIDKLINEIPNSAALLDVGGGSIDQITKEMMRVRSLTFLERKAFYLEERIKGQFEWYQLKSSFNRNKATFFSGCLIVFQILASIALVLNHYLENMQFDFVPFLLTATTSAIAWIELNRYRELSESYSLTANDLSMIISKGAAIQNEDELSEFVEDAELAISREHIVWLARRGNAEYLKKLVKK